MPAKPDNSINNKPKARPKWQDIWPPKPDTTVHDWEATENAGKTPYVWETLDYKETNRTGALFEDMCAINALQHWPWL